MLKTHTMMQQLRLPVVAVAFAGLGIGALAGYRLIGTEWRIVTCRPGATALARLELLFGMGKADGSEVSDVDWRGFLEAEVSPRFPEGLMVLTGYGHWRSSDGDSAREKSRVVEIWYRPATDSDAKIEAIRNAYKARFDQESVMRVDGVSCVSF